MSLLDNLVSAVVNSAKSGAADASGAVAAATDANAAPVSGIESMLNSLTGGGGLGALAGLASSLPLGDLVASLTAKAGDSGHDWKSSLGGLLKVLDMPHDQDATHALADKLNFTGDKSDKPGMEAWLHEKMIGVLADNGGKVPPNLHL